MHHFFQVLTRSSFFSVGKHIGNFLIKSIVEFTIAIFSSLYICYPPQVVTTTLHSKCSHFCSIGLTPKVVVHNLLSNVSTQNDSSWALSILAMSPLDPFATSSYNTPYLTIFTCLISPYLYIPLKICNKDSYLLLFREIIACCYIYSICFICSKL